MKVLWVVIMILGMFTRKSECLMQVAMKLAGEAILQALVQAAMNAVSIIILDPTMILYIFC